MNPAEREGRKEGREREREEEEEKEEKEKPRGPSFPLYFFLFEPFFSLHLLHAGSRDRCSF